MTSLTEPRRRRTPFLELPLLLGLVASPLLDDPWAVVLLGSLLLAWLALRPLRREAILVGLGLGAALAALALSAVQTRSGDPGAEAALLGGRLADSYRSLWSELQTRAREARAALPPLPPAAGAEPSPEKRLAAFQTLAEAVGSGPARRGALFVLDPDGRAWAWAGEGLLHEVEATQIPRSGSDYRASFGAVTLMVVLPLEEARRPWRVMAARSLTTDRLPFPLPGGAAVEGRWSLADGAELGGAGALTVTAEQAGLPSLVIQTRGEVGEPVPPARRPLHRAAWLGIAFALLATAVLRRVSGSLPAGEEGAGAAVHRGGWTALALTGSVALGAAAGVEAGALAALVGGLGLAAVGLREAGVRGGGGSAADAGRPDLPLPEIFPPDGPGRGRLGAAFGGAAVVVLLGLAAWGLQHLYGPLDLAAGLLAEPRIASLRLAFFAAALGLLALAVRRGEVRPRGAQDRWAWAAVGLLVAAGALHDLPPAGALLLVAGGAVSGLWLHGRRLGRFGTLAVLGCVAALASAGAWETVHRLELRRHLAGDLLPRMSPPSPQEIEHLSAELQRFFAGRDLSATVPRSPAGLQAQDLAFTLWKQSPLARSDALSALLVESPEGGRSGFSFGLPLDEEGQLDEEGLEELDLPMWRERRIEGEAEILYGGQAWGRARWWLHLQPGFRLRGERRLENIEAGLLAGRLRADRVVEGLPAPAIFALYDARGRVLRCPWDEAPPLAPELASGEPATVETPAGRARAFPRRGTEGWEVLYLPVLTALAALERVATHAASVLLVAGLLTLVALLLALPRRGFRELVGRTYRSYSRRLILVNTVLVLLPLALVNVLVVTGAEERFEREQRAQGEEALRSLEGVLVEYVRNLPPGISLQTRLTDDYLAFLSRIAHHEVNLYWQSELFVSSKAELFAAGLLPKRIPGEIYGRLLLRGYDLASRVNRVGDTNYLELYSPLRLSGEPQGENQLILSLPMLAQQVEVARELAALRRQVALVTGALFGLLIAVGLRVARSFTTPLMELVEGTRRIAAGASSLDLAPTELELASLVRAVDDMARRIAEGRQKLLREKQVVDRMVDNITAGVVSLDRERRVLMRNRVAAELLGVEVGERLDPPAAGGRRPAPVAAVLARVEEEPRQQTVRLTGEGGEEREWNLVWVPLPGSGEPAALLVVEDATEVLRRQRLEAWAEMARIIAHEIKNPLTPIRLNAEHIKQVFASDPAHFQRIFDRCIGNILTQVDELQQIASEFSTYSSILRIERKEGDLVEVMAELVEPYRHAPPQGVEVHFEAQPASITARFDRRLLSRAVRNLLENALRASSDGGRVTLRVAAVDGTGRISVCDDGPGVEPELLGRIFDPYFSTHDTGTGLGLPIARRIAEEHGGGVAARNRPQGGLEVTITVPLS